MREYSGTTTSYHNGSLRVTKRISYGCHGGGGQKRFLVERARENPGNWVAQGTASHHEIPAPSRLYLFFCLPKRRLHYVL